MKLVFTSKVSIVPCLFPQLQPHLVNPTGLRHHINLITSFKLIKKPNTHQNHLQDFLKNPYCWVAPQNFLVDLGGAENLHFLFSVILLLLRTKSRAVCIHSTAAIHTGYCVLCVLFSYQTIKSFYRS